MFLALLISETQSQVRSMAKKSKTNMCIYIRIIRKVKTFLFKGGLWCGVVIQEFGSVP